MAERLHMEPDVKAEFERLRNLAIEANSRANKLEAEAEIARRENRDYTNKCISLLVPFSIGDIIEYSEKYGYDNNEKTIRMLVRRFAFSFDDSIYVMGEQVNKENKISNASKRFSITNTNNPFKSIIKKAENDR